MYEHTIHKPEDALEYLRAILPKYIEDERIEQICSNQIEDREFQTHPASREKHHVYEGGLMVHTAQVVALALDMTRHVADIDTTVLVAGAVMHDSGKLICNNWNNGQLTKHQAEFEQGHLAAGHAMWLNAAFMAEVDGERARRIGHIILSHHGRLEWGSPVVPITPEAWVVHSADMMSSQFLSDVILHHIYRQ